VGAKKKEKERLPLLRQPLTKIPATPKFKSQFYINQRLHKLFFEGRKTVNIQGSHLITGSLMNTGIYPKTFFKL